MFDDTHTHPLALLAKQKINRVDSDSDVVAPLNNCRGPFKQLSVKSNLITVFLIINIIIRFLANISNMKR